MNLNKTSISKYADLFNMGADIGATGNIPGLQYTYGIKVDENVWALLLPDGSIIDFKTILSIDVDSTNQVIQAPTEAAFASYNKAIGPTRISITAAVQGNETERQELIQKLLALSGDMSLLTLVTPEGIFSNYNLEGVTYSRKPEDGINVVYPELDLVEIKEVERQFTNVKVAKKKPTGKKNGKESALHGLKDFF